MLIAAATAQAEKPEDNAIARCRSLHNISEDSSHELSTTQLFIYTDSSKNLFWSKPLPDTYTNSEDSEAEQACQILEARLPTKEEYESLIGCFEHNNDSHGPRLTPQGKKQMQAIFGDDIKNWFWSSSANSSDSPSQEVYFFSGLFGDIYDTNDRAYDKAVQCVLNF